MHTRVALLTVGIWFVFSLLAILNGLCREKFISPYTSEHTGHVISTLTLALVIFITTYYFLSKISIDSDRTLLLIGLTWVILTVAFEFLFGHYITGHSWEKLFADYNILKGRVWVLILITELIAPIACKHFFR